VFDPLDLILTEQSADCAKAARAFRHAASEAPNPGKLNSKDLFEGWLKHDFIFFGKVICVKSALKDAGSFSVLAIPEKTRR